MRHICLLSGGKDSTALAIYMRDNHPNLPMEYLFCDTHKELPETYDYLARVEAYLGQPIIRLISDKEERGFDFWLDMYRGFLPSPSARWCTRNLKLEPFEDYVGEEPVCLYVGIRADEQRSGYISTKPNIVPYFPFKDAGVTKQDVISILENSGVGVPEYYKWRSRSGCYFCFFQRRIEWVGLLENHPDLFELSKQYEKPDQNYTWAQAESLADLENPKRIEDIKQEDEKRRMKAKSRRKPKSLVEVFTGEIEDMDDENSCLICHL